jgi:hypothetical protein
MSFVRRFAALGASLMAAAAIGVMGAGTASASTTAAHLCVEFGGYDITDCAYAQGPKRTLMSPLQTTKSMTNWYYPTSGYGQFRQANTDVCMQLDAADGNIVIEATCRKASGTTKVPAYQLWEPVATSDKGGFEYRSEWNTTVCLTRDVSKFGSMTTIYLDDRGCSPAGSPNWPQVFYHM